MSEHRTNAAIGVRSRFFTSTMTSISEILAIELVYALPHKQEIVALRLPQGATVRQAIMASGLLDKYPEIDLAKNKLGIFSKLAKPETVLRDRDRVEIYRPLLVEPKGARQRRVAKNKQIQASMPDH